MYIVDIHIFAPCKTFVARQLGQYTTRHTQEKSFLLVTFRSTRHARKSKAQASVLPMCVAIVLLQARARIQCNSFRSCITRSTNDQLNTPPLPILLTLLQPGMYSHDCRTSVRSISCMVFPLPRLLADPWQTGASFSTLLIFWNEYRSHAFRSQVSLLYVI